MASAFVDLVSSPPFARHLGTTLFETVTGFVIGSSIGFALAVLDVTSALVATCLQALHHLPPGDAQDRPGSAHHHLAGFRVPVEGGAGGTARFFPVFANSVVGLSVLDDFTLRLMQSLDASKWQVIRYLRIPSAMPAFFVGLRTAMTFALIGAVVSEMIAARQGLGLILVRYQAGFDIALMYAVIVVLVIVGLSLFLVIGWLDRRVVFWRKDKSFF